MIGFIVVLLIMFDHAVVSSDNTEDKFHRCSVSDLVYQCSHIDVCLNVIPELGQICKAMGMVFVDTSSSTGGESLSNGGNTVIFEADTKNIEEKKNNIVEKKNNIEEKKNNIEEKKNNIERKKSGNSKPRRKKVKKKKRPKPAKSSTNSTNNNYNNVNRKKEDDNVSVDVIKKEDDNVSADVIKKEDDNVSADTINLTENTDSVVDLRVPAVITSGIRNITVPPGATARFNCKAEGAPAPVIMISLVDDLQETSEFNSTFGERITSVAITQEIEKVTEQNEGWYHCVAANALGRDEVKAYLRVVDLCSGVECGQGELCVADYLTETTKCVCPDCENVFDIVCGTNCEVYANPCQLERENCVDKTNIGILQMGYCPLIVEPQPTLSAREDQLFFAPGDRLSVVCGAGGKASPSPNNIYWARYDATDPNAYYKVSPTETLNVAYLTEEDSGDYYCIVEQCTKQYKSRKLTIKVEVVPTEGLDDLTTNTKTCTVYGDPHFVTFDGLSYDYMGVCDYVLAMDCNYATWLVYGRTEECGYQSNQGSCLNSITVFSGTTALELQRGWIVNNRGNKMNITLGEQYKEGEVTVEFDGRYLVLRIDSKGVTIHWDGLVSAHILVNAEARTCGLCGDNNGDPDNDLSSQRGRDGGDEARFGDAWTVDRLGRCGGVGPALNQECSATTRGEAKKRCESAFGAPGLAFCKNVLDDGPYIAACIHDICSQSWLSDKLPPECTIVTTFVRNCALKGIRVLNWESRANCPSLDRTQNIIIDEGCPQDIDLLLRRRL